MAVSYLKRLKLVVISETSSKFALPFHDIEHRDVVDKHENSSGKNYTFLHKIHRFSDVKATGVIGKHKKLVETAQYH